MYLTQQIQIKKGHKLYAYCEDLCKKSNNLYNRTAFIVRQYVFAKDAIANGEPMHENTKETYELVENLTKNYALINKSIKHPTKLDALTGPAYAVAKMKFLRQYEVKTNVRWLNYNTLDFVFKLSNDVDYYALPSHANQHIMKQYFSDLKGYFESLKRYKANPSGFTGMPRIPGYKKSGGMTTAYLSNIVCKIKDSKYLMFPKTKERLNFGKYGLDGTLKEVRIKPVHNMFVIDVVLERQFEDEIVAPKDKEHDAALLKQFAEMTKLESRAIAIDPGLDNLATVTNNFGADNFIISGKQIKSINQMYNKAKAECQSHTMLHNYQKYTTHMHKLDKNRNNRIKDLIHKASYKIVKFAKENNVKYVIMGHNDRQKDSINIGKSNNQNFVMIPHMMLINQLRYKLYREGIEFVLVEESYTSKASFENMDKIPTFGKDDKDVSFTGTRLKRGLYKSQGSNCCVNADLNGAANIMRKAFPNVLEWPLSMVKSPKRINLK